MIPHSAPSCADESCMTQASSHRHPNHRPVIAHLLHRMDVAGAEVLAAELGRRLAATPGHPYRFLYLCLDGCGTLGEQLAAEGFEVINLNRRPGLDFALTARLRRLLADRRVDLVHAHQYTPFFYAAAARGVASRPAILFTEHGRHYPDVRRTKRVMANRLLLRRHDRVTAVGSFVKQALVTNEGFAPDRIEVIQNGIDAEPFAEAAESRQTVRDAVRRELDVPAETPLVLQVARFHPVKDHGTAIRAFAQVVTHEPEAVLALAGDGPQREAMQALVRELGIEGQVRFLGLRRDVPRLMRAADVFLLSSLSEGISLTLLEAMATPLPIVATDVGGNGEAVEHGVTGLLSPRGYAMALAANLVRLLRDAELRAAMARAGRRRFNEFFTQDRMHAAYAAVYQEMLTGRAVRRAG